MKTLTKSLFISLAAILLSCKDGSEEVPVETQEISFTKQGDLFLISQNDTLQKLEVELADEPYEWETGLMYRTFMEDYQGMLFIYPDEAPRSFYMKNTYIPLDILYFSKDSILVSAQENTRPLDETPLPSVHPAKFILEINAGKTLEWNMKEGDRFSFRRVPGL